MGKNKGRPKGTPKKLYGLYLKPEHYAYLMDKFRSLTIGLELLTEADMKHLLRTEARQPKTADYSKMSSNPEKSSPLELEILNFLGSRTIKKGEIPAGLPNYGVIEVLKTIKSLVMSGVLLQDEQKNIRKSLKGGKNE